MALIGPWMHSDTIGPKTLYIECNGTYVRIVLATSISQGGYFVYINA